MEVRKLKLKPQTRELAVEAFERQDPESEGGLPVYWFPVSSEVPVERYYGTEILVHEPDGSSVDMQRVDGGSVLDESHWGPMRGCTVDAEIRNDRRLYVGACFSENPEGQALVRDISSKPPIKRNVSIRYIPLEADVEIDKSGHETWRWTKWQYVHTAFVADPADAGVGIGRSEPEERELEVQVRRLVDHRNPPSRDKEEAMSIRMNRREGEGDGGGSGVSTIDVSRERTAAVADRNAEIIEIERVCEQFEIPADTRRQWLSAGLDRDQVSKKVLEILAQRAKESVHRQPPAEGSRPEIERRQNDVQRYRYSRAIAMAAGLVKREGIEYEMSRELERARSSMGIETPDAPGTPIYVPYRLLTEEQRQARLERTLSAGIKGQGAELVSAGGTVELIEMLKNDTVLSRAGATVLTGLTAPLTFAKQTGAIGFKWYGAGKTIDLSDMKFLPEELSVKRMGGAQDYDRELLIQSSIDVENMVVRDGTQGVSIGLDFAGFNGTGGPEPLGFWNLPSSSGLNSAAMGGVPTFPKLTAVPALCRRKNGLTRESTWLAAPELAALLQATAKISGVTAGLIWEGSLDEGQMAGYRALTSSQLLQKIGSGTDEYQLAFGPWRFYVIGLFGGLMVTIDPYTQALNNAARVVFNMHGNVINRYPEAFVRCTGAKIA